MTRGIISAVQKINKDNKSVASSIAPRQATQTIGRQDTPASAKAYAMKAVEDKDAPNVIVGKFSIFETNVYALIDQAAWCLVHKANQGPIISPREYIPWLVCQRWEKIHFYTKEPTETQHALQ